MAQASKGNRRGDVFSVRLTPHERAAVDALQARGGGPRALGPWVKWRALGGDSPAQVLPDQGAASVPGAGSTPPAARIILDLCGGSGEWSAPYRAAGYDVRVVTLPGGDVCTFKLPPRVHGILAAPPCTEFSLAKNGQPRDFGQGMAVVNGCMRVVLQAKSRGLVWWSLENPVGYLGEWLGAPVDVWDPCDFGDPWTKRTALWGEFELPRRGPFVPPRGSIMDIAHDAASRAVTPAGFARAFFEANP